MSGDPWPTHHSEGKLEKVKTDGINQIQVAIDTLKNRPDDRGIKMENLSGS